MLAADSLGYITTTGYDVQNRPNSTLDAAGGLSVRTFDRNGRGLAAIDAIGRTTTTLYDNVGRVTGQHAADGTITTASFDSRGNVVSHMDARGNVRTYGYDVRGLQKSAMDPYGNTVQTGYDLLARAIQFVDQLGYVSTQAYDPRGLLWWEQNAHGSLTTHSYDPNGQHIARVDALGFVTQTGYDPAGRVVTVTDALGVVTTHSYDPDSNRVGVQNGIGVWTSYSYDGLSRLSQKMDPLGRIHTKTYDAASRPLNSIDAKGQVTTHVNDPRGYLIGRQYADPSLNVGMTRDLAGQVLAMTDATGLTTLTYDPIGRVASHNGPANPNGGPVSYTYDGNGNLTFLFGPWGTTSFTYEARDLLAALTDPGSPVLGVASGITSLGYDQRGLKVLQLHPNGTRASQTWDTLGRIVSVVHSHVATGNVIATVQYQYDALSRPTLKQVQAGPATAGSGVHTFTHDGNGRLTSETTPWSAGPVSYPYAANGIRQAVVQPNGQITTYVHDPADQLVNLVGGPTGALIATYTHDLNGSNLTAEVTGVGLTSYTWDAANRLQQTVFPDGHFRQNVYRADGLRHSNQTYSAAGSLVTQETTLWDSAGRQQSLSVQTAFGPGASAYEQDGTIAGAWQAAGIGTDGYWIAGLTKNLPSYVGMGDLTLPSSQITIQSNPSGSVTAAEYPSGDGRISASWNPTSGGSNPLTVDLTITDSNIHRVGFYSAAFYPVPGVTLEQTITLTDSLGNLLWTTVQTNYGPGAWSFFNVTGTVTVTIQGNGSAPTTLSAIVFDPPTGGVGPAPLPQQQPAVLIQNPAAGMSGIGLLRSVALPGAGTTLDNGGTGGTFTDPSRQYHVDGLGTVLALTDASGVVTASYDADAFGASVSPGSESVAGDPYSYLGGLGYWHDADAGLYYVRSRWLDPSTGRWLSVDPVEGEPRYSYADNAPTTGVDPSGTQVNQAGQPGAGAYAFKFDDPSVTFESGAFGPSKYSMVIVDTTDKNLSVKIVQTWNGVKDANGIVQTVHGAGGIIQARPNVLAIMSLGFFDVTKGTNGPMVSPVGDVVIKGQITYNSIGVNPEQYFAITQSGKFLEGDVPVASPQPPVPSPRGPIRRVDQAFVTASQIAYLQGAIPALIVNGQPQNVQEEMNLNTSIFRGSPVQVYLNKRFLNDKLHRAAWGWNAGGTRLYMVVGDAMSIQDITDFFTTRIKGGISYALLADGSEKATLWARQAVGVRGKDNAELLSSSGGVDETQTFLAVVVAPRAPVHKAGVK